MVRVITRSFEPGDEEQIVEMYNRITRRSRTVAQHQWEWLRNPEGEGTVLIIEWEENGSKRIIGHHGLIPVRMLVNGREILAGKTENTIVDPDYRKRILYFKYEKQFLESIQNKYDLLFTTSGRGPTGRIRRKLGYMEVGGYAHYVKCIDRHGLVQMSEILLNRSLHSKKITKFMQYGFKLLAPLTLRVVFRGQGSIDSKVSFEYIDRLDGNNFELQDFWEQNKLYYGCTIDRNIPFLDWRVFSNPHEEYFFLVAKKNNQVIGYAIFRYVDGRNKIAHLIDIVVKQNDWMYFNTILEQIVAEAKARKFYALVFRTLLSSNYLNTYFQRNGFLSLEHIIPPNFNFLKLYRKSEPPFLLVKIVNEKILKAEHLTAGKWYYTSLFQEGIGEPKL